MFDLIIGKIFPNDREYDDRWSTIVVKDLKSRMNISKDYFGGLSEMLRITKDIKWAINVFICVPFRCLPAKDSGS